MLWLVSVDGHPVSVSILGDNGSRMVADLQTPQKKFYLMTLDDL